MHCGTAARCMARGVAMRVAETFDDRGRHSSSRPRGDAAAGSESGARYSGDSMPVSRRRRPLPSRRARTCTARVIMPAVSHNVTQRRNRPKPTPSQEGKQEHGEEGTDRRHQGARHPPDGRRVCSIAPFPPTSGAALLRRAPRQPHGLPVSARASLEDCKLDVRLLNEYMTEACRD